MPDRRARASSERMSATVRSTGSGAASPPSAASRSSNRAASLSAPRANARANRAASSLATAPSNVSEIRARRALAQAAAAARRNVDLPMPEPACRSRRRPASGESSQLTGFSSANGGATYTSWRRSALADAPSRSVISDAQSCSRSR